jgi:hypothetical protein
MESGGGGEVVVTLFAIAIFAVVPIFVAHRLGKSKGRANAWLWGFLLGWIGVLIVALLSSKAGDPEAAVQRTAPGGPPNERGTKTCPDCAEDVLAEARRCRFCGYRFDTA